LSGLDRARAFALGLRWRFRYLRRLPDVDEYYRRADASPQRLFLSRLVAFDVPRRVLDVGCGFGQDLWLVHRSLSRVGVVDPDLWGVDVNPRVLSAARSALTSRGVSASLRRASVFDVVSLGRFDVVFSDAVLMYVPPYRVEEALRYMVAVAPRVVLCEFQGPELFFRGKWVHDYVGILRSWDCRVFEFSALEVASFSPDSDWGRFGAFVVAVRDWS